MIRDASCNFIAAKRSSFKAPKVAVAEALAVLESFIVAKQHGINNVVVESDAKETVLCLHNSIENGSWEALLIFRKIIQTRESLQNPAAGLGFPNQPTWQGISWRLLEMRR